MTHQGVGDPDEGSVALLMPEVGSAKATFLAALPAATNAPAETQ